jgi:hypothetical protein
MKLVGEQFFNGLAYTFIKQTPSSSPNIGECGEGFADFIAGFPPAQSLPYLADVCRLCWCYHLAYQAPTHLPFDVQSFAKIPDDQKDHLIFQLPPSALLLRSDYPIKAMWTLCQSNQSTQTISLDDGGVNLLIWRQEEHINIHHLSEEEWLLASQLDQQVTLGQLQQIPALQTINTAELLPVFLKKGWLTGWSSEHHQDNKR